MSCRCMHQQMASEIERHRRLAKALARIEKQTVILYQKEDGTFDFDLKSQYIANNANKLIEYVTQY